MKNGFTLIELMLAVAILAVVLTLGVPSLTEIIKNNRTASQINGLISTLNFARSEAVKLGNVAVTICVSTDQATCNRIPTWESGWIVFRDTNADGDLDAGETLLRVQPALSGGNTLRTSGFVDTDRIQFANRGTTNQTGTFTLCDDRRETKAYGVIINVSGQARTATDDDAPNDDIRNNHNGVNLVCP